MAPLNSGLRGVLERAVVAAREAAERAAGASLETLAVGRGEAFATHTPEQRSLRVALRARARQLGGGSLHDGLPLLAEEIACEQWHRMLFARFLIENDLLMLAPGVSLSLEDCAEMAAEAGDADSWQYAARIAGQMLPGIFRADDPSVQVRFAVEGRTALEAILIGLPSAVFTSDDGLGWVYQFWQSKQKEAVNDSGRKIGGADLAPVTQLFTEDYMVRFLLENSLGAWWAARHPDSPLVETFVYLRRMDNATPAAGTFPDWPERVAEVTVIDPCCGSGHFLVAAFEMLRQMRMEEEGLTEAAAADAVLTDNLFGLELDPRCVQIAAFALALAAWKVGGYRPLPVPNLACSGVPVSGQLDEWTKLTGKDPDLCNSLERLYHLFRNAPDLGSLIDPANAPIRDRMFAPDFSKVGPLLDRALAREAGGDDPVTAVFGESARAVAQAANLLGRRYTLVTTNVPYLTRGKHDDVLMAFGDANYPDSKTDLATMFVERGLAFCAPNATLALVCPQNWQFLSRYKSLRLRLLEAVTFRMVIPLGAGAFRTISGEVVRPSLIIADNSLPRYESKIGRLDELPTTNVEEKISMLLSLSLKYVDQRFQKDNPDAIIGADMSHIPLLRDIAESSHGVGTFDGQRFLFRFWEIMSLGGQWVPSQSSVKRTLPYGGCEFALRWEDGRGGLARMMDEMRQNGYTSGKWRAGSQIWGRKGILVGLMGNLPVTLYTGQAFDENVGVIVPRDDTLLPALWAFCSSGEFAAAVRALDQSIKVTIGTLVKVPFDEAYWRSIAGTWGNLPEPYSNDPTQWLFEGDPAVSTEPLQVAVARLLGYRWPKQQPDHLGRFADDDGIVPLVPVAGEETASERLRALLAAAYGDAWSADRLDQLLYEADFGGRSLEMWLRDRFFEQHAKLFQQRPFIWQVWDGRRGDGFSALVNSHKLDRARLDKLIHTYLGGWIRTQRAAGEAGVAGADDRLVKAVELQRKLEAIRVGEPPYDIYVRWKRLHEQPIGWEPDLNDGVRLNIRPFVTAGVLRSRVNVKWEKDRGKNPDGSERRNDLHYTVAEKRAARDAAGV